MDNDLEQQITRDLAQRLTQHIDDGFRADALVAAGWTQTEIPVIYRGFWANTRTHPIETWLAANCGDRYLVLSHCVLFKKAADATMFVLRWSQQ
jgi:hypothetical protein